MVRIPVTFRTAKAFVRGPNRSVCGRLYLSDIFCIVPPFNWSFPGLDRLISLPRIALCTGTRTVVASTIRPLRAIKPAFIFASGTRLPIHDLIFHFTIAQVASRLQNQNFTHQNHIRKVAPGIAFVPVNINHFKITAKKSTFLNIAS